MDAVLIIAISILKPGKLHEFSCWLKPCFLCLGPLNNHLPFNRGFPCGSVGKESTCNVGDLGSIPGIGKSPGEGKGYPLQYSGLENFIDCIIHGVTKSWTRLSDFHVLTSEESWLLS